MGWGSVCCATTGSWGRGRSIGVGVVPGRREGAGESEREPVQLRFVLDARLEVSERLEAEESSRASRHRWAWLLRRVFGVDVLTTSAAVNW